MTEDSEEKNEFPGGIIKQTIDSATALSKAVPIYDDALQPLAKETGKALGTVGKAVNVALAPISLVVWGYDQIKFFLESKVTDKLENIPEDRIASPPTFIVGPAVEALKFTGHNEVLQDLFANLIANSLDLKTVLEAHPSFVDIIKNISPDEAMILRLFIDEESYPMLDVKLKSKGTNGYRFLDKNVSTIGSLSNCKHPQLTNNYLDNLCRLGILSIPSGRVIDDKGVYEELNNTPNMVALTKQYENEKKVEIEFSKKCIEVTGMGKQFIKSCVVDKKNQK